MVTIFLKGEKWGNEFPTIGKYVYIHTVKYYIAFKFCYDDF